MTVSRVLPLLNLAGCLLVTGVLVAQWLKERGLGDRIDSLSQQLVSANEQLDQEKKRAAALESDVSQLKESIEATVRSRRETEEALAKLVAEREAQAATATQSSQEQVEIWEKAIADRDAKILDLNTGLTATRERLDEAIRKLKEAGAR